MIECKRYPHVRDLLLYYTEALADKEVSLLIENGISSKEQATVFSLFIWKMADQMRVDTDAKKVVLGDTDNSHMLADVHYEVSLYMAEKGYESVWEKISDEA